MASAWNVAWGQAWGDAWGHINAPTIFYQNQRGGGLPRISKAQHEREHELSAELEQTMRTMLWHPKAVAAVAESVTDIRETIRHRQRQATAQTLQETRARLEHEQDEEDWILMS